MWATKRFVVLSTCKMSNLSHLNCVSFVIFLNSVVEWYSLKNETLIILC